MENCVNAIYEKRFNMANLRLGDRPPPNRKHKTLKVAIEQQPQNVDTV